MEGPVSSCAAPIEFIAGLSGWLIPAKADRNMGSMQASKSGIYSTVAIMPFAWRRVATGAASRGHRVIALSAEPYRLDNLQQKAAAIPATTIDPASGTLRATVPWAED